MSSARLAFMPKLGALILAGVVFAVAIALAIHLRAQGTAVRGYTVVGLGAAVLALFSVALAAAYSWRKRSGQERSTGPLSAWLAWHLVFSALAVAAVWLHSGGHFDGRTGTYTTVLLALALGSGLFGLYRYLNVPGQVLADVGNLAPGTLELEIRRLQQARDLLLSSEPTAASDSRVAQLDADIAARRDKLARQGSYRGKLRGWLWVHIPASVALAFVLAWHVQATWTTAFPTRAASPVVFESAKDCKGCHARQFAEWSGSMHAMAMQSPLTDIQNRLVLALEQEQLQKGTLTKELVGDLCVRCHAPSAYIGNRAGHEPNAAPLNTRSLVSAEGITCTVCHRMPEVHACASPKQIAGETFRRCEGGDGADQERQFYNAANLDFATGRAYYGSLGAEGVGPPSVGNSYHRGLTTANAQGSLEARSQSCASCHTVQVHDPSNGKMMVRLQDTYEEWREGGKISWQEQFACADCHNARFDRSLQQISSWQQARVCLPERTAGIRAVMAREFASLPLRTSAEPADAFDRPLPLRTRLNHAFVGVDHHLEPTLPAKHYPAFAGVDVPVADALAGTNRLLQMAAAVRIESIVEGRLDIDVANLATGHTLPAGFAFARELWVEVAVSPSEAGDDWQVVIGGRDGRPLVNGEVLDKRQPGLRNFQKVLFSSTRSEEVVLQNQADSVLTGEAANGKGFIDRVEPIEPGGIRQLQVDLGAQRDLRDVRRVRARLRFRSLPPEFLEKMAVLAMQRGLSEDAARLRAMIGKLHVFDIAQDERLLSSPAAPSCR